MCHKKSFIIKIMLLLLVLCSIFPYVFATFCTQDLFSEKCPWRLGSGSLLGTSGICPNPFHLITFPQLPERKKRDRRLNVPHRFELWSLGCISRTITFPPCSPSHSSKCSFSIRHLKENRKHVFTYKQLHFFLR